MFNGAAGQRACWTAVHDWRSLANPSLNTFHNTDARVIVSIHLHVSHGGVAVMSDSKFHYVIYIRTSIEKLWDALTLPEYTRAYWCETTQVSDWKSGSAWKMVAPNGRLGDSGEVLEFEKPKRFVLKWRHEIMPEMKAEGYSKCVIELEPAADAVKLTLTHSNDVPNSKFIAAIAQGWPGILSSLKSLLETGEALEITKHWPKEM